MKEQDRTELVYYRINKAKETLNEVKILVNNKLWNTSVNRLYYACYYAVSALLAKNKIKAQTHSGVRKMFGLHFIKSGLIEKTLGKYYSDIFDKRQTCDYNDFIEYQYDDIKDLIEPAKELISKIESIIIDIK
jgi:uncharacterized protein